MYPYSAGSTSTWKRTCPARRSSSRRRRTADSDQPIRTARSAFTRLEIAGSAAVSRFEAMTVAVVDLAHARRTVEDGGIATETTEAGFAADGLFFTEQS